MSSREYTPQRITDCHVLSILSTDYKYIHALNYDPEVDFRGGLKRTIPYYRND